VALLARAKVLGDRRVKVRADLRAIRDVSLLSIGSWTGNVLVFVSEAAASVHFRCTRVSVNKAWTIN